MTFKPDVKLNPRQVEDRRGTPSVKRIRPRSAWLRGPAPNTQSKPAPKSMRKAPR